MPVTLKVAEHGSEAFECTKAISTRALLRGTSPSSAQSSKGIVQSSFSKDTFENSNIIPSSNGFVKGAFRAYSEHAHFTIRPDDVWFAILSQLSFYINANAEALRDHFVSHQGQKELEVSGVGTIHSVDMGAMARRMTALIQDNVKDPDLRDWMMPAFSTTTVNDRTTAAVLMMGSMQSYFTYKCRLRCGLPSITLLGECADYEDILTRLDKLPELGPETSQFADLLRPVLRRFIATFDPAQDAASRDFWGRIAHKRSGGSGPSYLGGWLTAFCFWNEKGNRLKRTEPHYSEKDGLLQLDGVAYDRVKIEDIPPGCASVPVLIDDNGKVYHTKMIAGSLGIECTSSSDSKAEFGGEEESKPDSMQSLSGWIMYEVDSNNAESDDDSRKYYR